MLRTVIVKSQGPANGRRTYVHRLSDQTADFTVMVEIRAIEGGSAELRAMSHHAAVPNDGIPVDERIVAYSRIGADDRVPLKDRPVDNLRIRAGNHIPSYDRPVSYHRILSEHDVSSNLG